MRTLSADELGRVVAEVERAAPKRHADVYLLACTGIRAGELHALEWCDVDEERGLIALERAVWHRAVATTKTDDPREIALIDACACCWISIGGCEPLENDPSRIVG